MSIGSETAKLPAAIKALDSVRRMVEALREGYRERNPMLVDEFGSLPLRELARPVRRDCQTLELAKLLHLIGPRPDRVSKQELLSRRVWEIVDIVASLALLPARSPVPSAPGTRAAEVVAVLAADYAEPAASLHHEFETALTHLFMAFTTMSFTTPDADAGILMDDSASMRGLATAVLRRRRARSDGPTVGAGRSKTWQGEVVDVLLQLELPSSEPIVTR